MKQLPTLLLSLSLLFTSVSWANTAKQVRQTEANAQQLAKEVQAQVEKLDAKRQEDFNKWRQARHELLVIEAYNQRQAEWVASLEDELVSLEEQLASIENTDAELQPLLNEMLQTLEKDVLVTDLEKTSTKNLPFKQEAQQAKLKYLQELPARADLSLAEKLRQFFTTYRQAVEAGRSLQVSKEFISIAPNTKETRHTLLRLGNLGLYALSEDAKQAYVWQAAPQKWSALTSSQRKELIQTIRMTEQKGLPSLLRLPLSISLSSNQQEAN